MDNVLSALARLFGRILGRNIECGLDCETSGLGWPEYILLAIILGIAYFLTRKIINHYRSDEHKDA